ncbi:MAG TPA: bifunctional biotin--[acetyl-CoA-carboxylase] ligase/biotin operon repressor BirA [Candidatus Competibacteraceae bacterium]|nr:bifunctional biotin--[acetyl-CoA-carboxylase] ligase/biotin operon repressor BirA [Candidatus Competibacteraceae bacterium]
MSRERQILTILGDGAFHSGAALAQRLGVTRAAVWQVVARLQSWGLEIHAVKGRGYRLALPLELLDGERIRALLPESVAAQLTDIEIHERIDSTNTHLLQQARQGRSEAVACLAEQQLAGRGRRGRGWVSPYGTNLYLSLLWRFELDPGRLSGLSLVTGIALMRVLHGLGAVETGLKWPNDVLWRERKLGGVLLEFAGEASGPCQVVTGIGLNVLMPAAVAAAIDQPWCDLRTVLGGTPVSRNRLAAAILAELLPLYQTFERDGFIDLAGEWAGYDLCYGRSVRVLLPTQALEGVARGVDDSGALLLQTANGLRVCHAGEVSLRLVP